MPSDQRFHPLTILFALGGELRNFLFPAILATMTASQGNGWERFFLVFLVPGGLAAVARYFSSTYRYDATELVVKTGILFKNERHIPFARIQSVDAVQNVLHRYFKVVDVKVRTGTGGEAEATLSVLPFAALDEMRRRVFEGRPEAQAPSVAFAEEGGEPPLVTPVTPLVADTLLRLTSRDLALAGLLDNRGWVVIGAAWGFAWQSGFVRIEGFEGFDAASWPLYASLFGGLAGLFVIAPLLSMLWATVRLHGFHLSRRGADVLVEYGALTRVTATIPLRRVQAVKIHQGPGHLWTKRAAVRVETAGGSSTGPSASEREWIAPIIRMADLPAFITKVLPAADLPVLNWQPVDPRGFRRRRTVALVWSAIFGGATAPWFGWWALAVIAALSAWWVAAARLYVRSLGWARTGRFVAFKTGWLRRRITIVPLEKIQAVSLQESPFDRRHVMASLRVDTAGAGANGINIPYLSRAVADGIRVTLASEAAATTFRW